MIFHIIIFLITVLICSVWFRVSENNAKCRDRHVSMRYELKHLKDDGNDRFERMDKILSSIEMDFYSLSEVKARCEERNALKEKLKNLGGDK